MLLMNTESSVMPEKVLVDRSRNVRLTDHVTEKVTEDGQTMYAYDEAVFALPEDRTETAEDILAAFDDWWAYGAQPDETPATLEDRINELEDLVFTLFGGEV